MEGNEKKVGAVVETKKKSKRSFGKSIVVSIMCFMLTFVSIISSFAVEETTDGSITWGLTTLLSLIGSVWSFMLANPLIMVFVACSLIGAAVGVFRKLKRASH